MAIKHDSNTDIFRGQLFIFLDGEPLAFAKTASLDVTSSEIDVSNKMINGGWEASFYGKNGFTLSSDSLITYKEGQLSFDTLLEKLINKETLPVFYGRSLVTDETTVGGEFAMDETSSYYKGIVMISSLNLKSDDGDIATCSVSLKGVGALELVRPNAVATSLTEVHEHEG